LVGSGTIRTLAEGAEGAEGAEVALCSSNAVRSEPACAGKTVMQDPGEIELFYDCCSELMRELLGIRAQAPDQPARFPRSADVVDAGTRERSKTRCACAMEADFSADR
jgi:hypothetical protein